MVILGALGFTELLFIIILGLSLIPTILFLVFLQDTFREISPENRKMEPGQVWLALIPGFGFIWQFIITVKLADSLKAEFIKRNLRVEEDRPGLSIGIAYCVLFCCCIIPILGIAAAIAGIICWILYWVKVSEFRKKLQLSKIYQ
jgi:hypothetical protein